MLGPRRLRSLGRQVSLPSKLRATATRKIQTLGRVQTVTSPPPGRSMQIRAPGSSWDLSAEPSDSQFLSRRARPPAARSRPWHLRDRRAAASSSCQAGRPRHPGPLACRPPPLVLGSQPAAPLYASPAGPPRRAPGSELKSPWSAAAAAPFAPLLSPRAGESQAPRARAPGRTGRGPPLCHWLESRARGRPWARGRGSARTAGTWDARPFLPVLALGRAVRAPRCLQPVGDRARRGEDAGASSSAGVSSREPRRGVVEERARGPTHLAALWRRPEGRMLSPLGHSQSVTGKPLSTQSGRSRDSGRDPGGDSSGCTIWASRWALGPQRRGVGLGRGPLPDPRAVALLQRPGSSVTSRGCGGGWCAPSR